MYNDNDYRDYLQHEGRAHKYILKIGKGAQARYFYTQQEIEAFRNKATKKAKGMANDMGAAVGVAKEKSRKIALSAKNRAKTIEKETRPTRKKIAKTVKREAKELRRDAKRKWDTSLPARKMRTAKAKRLKEIEKSRAYRDKVTDMNQGRIAPSTRTRYGHSIINNRNNKNLSERNREKLNQLYQKETSESEKKSKKKLQRSVKRDQLKKKAKGKLAIIKNKPASMTREHRIRQGRAKPISDYHYENYGGQGKETYTYTNKDAGYKYTVSERDREKREQLANNVRANRINAKKSKRKARRKKVKNVVNKVLRRG